MYHVICRTSKANAKAEKSRMKVLANQMDARRIKNKVRHSRFHPHSLFL